jgi:hypothetical protein
MTRCTGREQPSIRLLVGSSRSKGAHVIARSSRMRRAAQQGAPVAGVAPASRPLRMGVRAARRSTTRRTPRGKIDAGGEEGGAQRGVSLQLLYEWPVAELDYRKSYQAIQRFGGPSSGAETSRAPAGGDASWRVLTISNSSRPTRFIASAPSL